MTIERKDDFLTDTDIAGTLSIGIESDNLTACVEEVCKRKAVGVFGTPFFGFTQNEMNFLKDLPHLEKIWFWEVNINDIQGIYSLRELKHFGVHPKRPGIDFSRLPKLEEMVWEYNKNDTGIISLTRLSIMHIWHYNPKNKMFDGITIPNSVKELQINWSNPKSLEGIPNLNNLKRLEIHRSRNLESLSTLEQIAPNLEHLVVSACGKVNDGNTVVKKLPNLKHAYIQDTLLIKDGELNVKKSKSANT